MEVSTSSHPPWALALTEADLSIVGIADHPSAVLDTLTEIEGVDLNVITDCLVLLRDQPIVLHCGAPVGMMVYAPARKCYAASFDGNLDADLDALTEAQAGLWLAVMAAETPGLPTSADHWAAIKVHGRQLTGLDTAAIETYLDHADHLDEPADLLRPMSAYDRQLSRAFWALAGRCQEGR